LLGAAAGIAPAFVRDRQVLYRAFTQDPSEYLAGAAEAPTSNHKNIGHFVPLILIMALRLVVRLEGSFYSRNLG